jgi:hypothetical protein
MMYTDHEVPSDDEVIATLVKLGGHADAVALCRALMDAGHPQLESQLAIQRTAERRRLIVHRDWTLSTLPEAVAA